MHPVIIYIEVDSTLQNNYKLEEWIRLVLVERQEIGTHRWLDSNHLSNCHPCVQNCEYGFVNHLAPRPA